MRLISYRGEAGPTPAIVVGDRALDLASVVDGLEPSSRVSLREFLASDPDLLEVQASAARLAESNPAALQDLAGLALTAPIPDPPKVICVGLNYRAHIEEVGETQPTVPALFPKFANGLIGDGELIAVPPVARNVDFEAELAVVIGRRATAVAADQALDHVAGVMAFNDVSARDLQFATTQWTSGKIVDSFAPCGPWIVTIDEIDDIQSLALETRLNGEVVQSASTADMLFGVAELIAHISAFATLEPGDVIATGTPPGVGMGRKPPLYMSPGDTIEVEIESIGVLRNRVEAAGPKLTR